MGEAIKNPCLANAALPDASSRTEAELSTLLCPARCNLHMHLETAPADQTPQQPRKSLHSLVMFVLFIDLENVC